MYDSKKHTSSSQNSQSMQSTRLVALIEESNVGVQTAASDKERGIGDWQHYQSPKEILAQVAAASRKQLPPPPAEPANERPAVSF